MILSFSITGIQNTTTIDTQISIVDGLLEPIITQSVDETDIPLFYYGLEAKDIYDYVSIAQGNFGKNRTRVVYSGPSVELNTSNINITDQANIYFEDTVPLWYQHYPTSASLLGSSDIVGISLYDYNQQLVDGRLWKYDVGQKKLFSNVKNYIDPNTLRHVVYYASITYKDGQVVNELLNAQPVFRKSNSNLIAKRYSITVDNTSITAFINGASISSSKPLYIRENLEDTMDIKVYGDLNSSSWNLAVRNDYLLSDGAVYTINDSFTNSSQFYLYPNNIKILSKRVQVITPTLIWADLPGRFITDGAVEIDTGTIPDSAMEVTLIVRDASGNLKAVYTNYDTQNFVYNDSTNSVEAIFAINSISSDGYIKLLAEISPDDIIDISGNMLADYYIDGTNIKYTVGNSNYQLYAANKALSTNLLWINPALDIEDEEPNSVSVNTNVYTYLLKFPVVVASSISITVTDGLANIVTWTDNGLGVMAPSGGAGVSGTVNYTTGVITLTYNGTQGTIGYTSIKTDYRQAQINGKIKIGSVSVSKNRNFDSLTLLDVRQRGGGIDPKYKETVELIYPESVFYRNADNFTSLDLHISAGLIINLPGNLLLTKFGGQYEEGQVQAKVDSSVRAAIPGIVRYYNVVPEIESVEYGDTPTPYMIITWRDIKDFSYRLHFSYDGSDFSIVRPSVGSELPANTVDTYTGTYQYQFFYNPPTPNNNLIYVKIEGLYRDSNNSLIAGNFSETYRIVRI